MNYNFNENNGHKTYFPHKECGRIFVEKEEDIEKVKNIIKEIDEFEYDYLPKDFITVFNENNMRAVYTHKFSDLDIQLLTQLCWSRGIHMFCWNGKVNGYE